MTKIIMIYNSVRRPEVTKKKIMIMITKVIIVNNIHNNIGTNNIPKCYEN